MPHILAIDQGTTSTRSVVFDPELQPVASAHQEFAQHYPQQGWVEHDAEEIWQTVLATCREALRDSGVPLRDVACLGLTNQRETALIWDRATGRPLHRAIVWQDRRTAAFLQTLREAGREPLIRQRTGLLLDPYFSASKWHWLLEQIPDGRHRAAAGELAAGTIDSWLIHRLTGGRRHVTDVTNASRTLLMNLQTGQWDEELLELFGIHRCLLPEIQPTAGPFGDCHPDIFGSPLPITGAVGDQQAALFGQLCTAPGMVKCTYGTGCFLLQFTGPQAVASTNRLLTTVAWQIGDGPLQYALEGSVFMGGATVQWLRDGLGLIRTAAEINELAATVPDSGGVLLVPAFTGLGAPYWDPSARGTIVGLSRGSTAGHLARAALEGIAYQVADVVSAMEKDSGQAIPQLRVDGGACASDLLLQMQADLVGIPVDRPSNIESTVLGAARLAGLGAGLWNSPADLDETRRTNREFVPEVSPEERRQKMTTWQRAVQRASGWIVE